MKVVNVIVKILAALAAVVGAIYLLATYGEQIVAWCKKVMSYMTGCSCNAPAEEIPADTDEATEEVPVVEPVDEDPVTEEVPASEPAVEEIPADAVVADDSDFVG